MARGCSNLRDSSMAKAVRKAGVAAILVVVLGWLFWQTVQNSLSKPYFIDPDLIAEWRLVL